ncbi:MAG: hypothetical protein ACREXU_05265 [Gammaproteobacteria bacterium]
MLPAPMMPIRPENRNSMTPLLLRNLTVVPTLMAMGEARVRDRAFLLIAIAIQESDLTHRRQSPRGPARSWWQIEPATAYDTIGRYRPAADMLRELRLDKDYILPVLEWCDPAACAIAAGIVKLCPLALPAIPESAPITGAREACWEYYLRAWRPGKPRRERWDEAFEGAVKAMLAFQESP